MVLASQMSSSAIITPPTAETPTRVEFARFTLRQRQILQCLAAGKTLQETADELGVSRQRVHQLAQDTRGRLPELMEELGLSDAALVSRYLKPALLAEKTEFFQSHGKVTDQRNTIAWGPRLQALDIAAKMRGMYAKQADVTVENKIVIVVENIGQD